MTSLRRGVVALIFGLMFGAGLLVSGMSDPDRVRGFLDWSEAWNPSLAFVMAAAVVMAAPLFILARRRGRSLAGASLDQPATTRLDRSLIGGSALFGIGWGLAGICPGPALVLAGLKAPDVALFLIPMVAGLLAAPRRPST